MRAAFSAEVALFPCWHAADFEYAMSCTDYEPDATNEYGFSLDNCQEQIAYGGELASQEEATCFNLKAVMLPQYFEGCMTQVAMSAAVSLAYLAGPVLVEGAASAAAVAASDGVYSYKFFSAVKTLVGVGGIATGAADVTGEAVASAICNSIAEGQVNAILEHMGCSFEGDAVCVNPDDGAAGDSDPEDVGESIGCTQCDSWTTEYTNVGYFTPDGAVAECYQEQVCEEWSQNESGTDSNGDGWCD